MKNTTLHTTDPITPDSIMKYFWPIVIAVTGCFAVGYIASLLQADSISNWYPLLAKSPLTPAPQVFPIVWSIIYLCMGVSIGLAWYTPEKQFKQIFGLFSIQLILNFLWSILFFTLRSPLLGMIDILALDAAVLIYTIKTYRTSRVSAWLFVPYLAWLVIATYLNGYIMIANW